MTQPSAVISHLHMPMVRLQQQTIMPFIIMQQLHMPPASMLHRFCIMLQAILSVQVHVTFMPPVHFSNFMVQRGTIIMFMPAGMPGVIPVPMPVPPIMPVIIAVRSIIIVPVIERSLSFGSVGRRRRPDSRFELVGRQRSPLRYRPHRQIQRDFAAKAEKSCHFVNCE
jgi:hypothetical protein